MCFTLKDKKYRLHDLILKTHEKKYNKSYLKITQTIINFESVTDSFAVISGNFKNVFKKLKNSDGAIGTLIFDTTFVHKLNMSLDNIKNGAENFNKNMDELKHFWPIKKHFRNREKVNPK